MNTKYNFTQERSDYLTPPELVAECLKMLNAMKGYGHKQMFRCDVCCSFKNIPADHHFIYGEKDGLKEDWYSLNFCNPPYKDCDKWVKKAHEEMLKGNTSVLLIPARTETKYWQDYILKDGFPLKEGIYIKFLRKGYGFLNPETKAPMGVYKNPLAIVILGGIMKGAPQLQLTYKNGEK